MAQLVLLGHELSSQHAFHSSRWMLTVPIAPEKLWRHL